LGDRDNDVRFRSNQSPIPHSAIQSSIINHQSSMIFPQGFIDDLRLHANIVQVVQEYVPLKPAGGARFKGLCPFHAEKTPSFGVDSEKGFFYCFGCHKGGDVFKFLELHESMGFQDAVRMLAQKFGLPLPEVASSEDERRNAGMREALLKAHEIAAAYFREQLAGPRGSQARQQLNDRGINPETVNALQIGYAPQGREGLKERLLKQGFAEAVLLQSGLVVKRDSGEVVDRFRHRLMIPICRDTGTIIAFGGRQMEADQGGPKYLNSPETPIYSKGRTLYGLHLSKAGIRTGRYAVVVEGYFDFAQVFQSGAAPAVASSGTAFTEQQAQLLRRFTTRVVLSFDPDAAGQGAATRSCELLVREGFDVNVLTLDKGEDPDAFIRKHGGGAYRERLRTSRPYLEYLLDRAAVGLDFGQDEQRRQFLSKMLVVAAQIPDAAARDQFADRIAHKARVTEDVVRAEIRKAAFQKRTEVTEREVPTIGHLKQAEKGLIWGLIHNTSGALAALETLEEEDLTGLATRNVLSVARSLKELSSDGFPATWLQRLSTMDGQLVTSIAADSTPTAPAHECARAIKRGRCERELAGLQRQIDRLQALGADQHGNEINALWQKKIALLRRIEALT
jgi:DNA primase